jgi:hypothetical protein
MEKELLQTKLINQKKNTKQKRVAFNVLQILGAFLTILIISTYSRGSMEPLYIQLKFPVFLIVLIYLIPAILAVILLILYVNKPASGHLLFYDEHIDFKIKNSIKKINISELTKLTFSNNEDRYSIGLINNNQKIFYEIDIIFQHEKEIINSLVQKWKDKGYNVDIINKNEVEYQKTF